MRISDWSSDVCSSDLRTTMSLQASTRASINSTRGCRVRPRAPNPPISPRSRPTSGWISWKAASRRSRRRRAARRAVSGSALVANDLNPGPGGLRWPPVSFLGALVLALSFAGSGVASAKDAAAQPVAAVDELPPEQEVSDTVIELAGWVVATGDSQGYPFAIMDKAAAQILVFRSEEHSLNSSH